MSENTHFWRLHLNTSRLSSPLFSSPPLEISCLPHRVWEHPSTPLPTRPEGRSAWGQGFAVSPHTQHRCAGYWRTVLADKGGTLTGLLKKSLLTTLLVVQDSWKSKRISDSDLCYLIWHDGLLFPVEVAQDQLFTTSNANSCKCSETGNVDCRDA